MPISGTNSSLITGFWLRATFNVQFLLSKGTHRTARGGTRRVLPDWDHQHEPLASPDRPVADEAPRAPLSSAWALPSRGATSSTSARHRQGRTSAEPRLMPLLHCFCSSCLVFSWVGFVF